MLYKPTLWQVASGAYRNHARYRGCIGHWLLGEGGGLSPLDASGYRNHGTIVGTPTWTGGLFGPALALDGTTNYVDTNAGNSVRGLTQFSLSAWIRFNSVGTQQTIYSEAQNANGQPRLVVYAGAGLHIVVDVRIPDSAALNLMTSAVTLSATTWYHFVFIFDSVSDSHTMYINGILDRATTTAVAAFDNTASFRVPRIGASTVSGTENYFGGIIDDLRLYNRALTAYEISSLYNDPFLEFRALQEQQYFFMAVAAGSLALLGVGR